MCGIAGKLILNESGQVHRDLLQRMASMLFHRGPDDGGVFADGPVGLASRRLAIIDLSPQGHQPMSNEDGTIWVVFNGEIYNFQELQDVLLAKGHQFRSQTDTEVLVHLYEEHGADCVRHLRGMFAFAIWDSNNRTLFLARDRLGKKPLFYYFNDKVFLFASEPKAILVYPSVPSEADPEAIHYYLTYQYVPSPLSAFKGFRKLPPAHCLTVRNGSLDVRRYWKLSYGQKIRCTEEELCEQLLHHLREAVRLRMISDVALGAFLSGGIDSSSVVAFMSEFSNGPVKTFSIGFEDEDFNELPHAREVSRLFGTDHHEFIVRPNAVEVLPQLSWHYNEPYGDHSALPSYYLSKLARQHVTVALNGDGGDESFGGYWRHEAMQLAQKALPPNWLRHGLSVANRMIPDFAHSPHLLKRLKRFSGRVSTDPRRSYGALISHFTDETKAELYTEEFRSRAGPLNSLDPMLDTFAASDARKLLDAALDVDVSMYLADNILVKMDIASMAQSLEARSPLVDHRLMEFLATVPAHFKVAGGVRKYLFKKALSGILPQEIINREKKGFSMPIDRWFKEDLLEMLMDTLLSRQALERGYFKPETVRRLIEDHASGRATWHDQLWTLLMLELWHHAFIDRMITVPS